VDPHRQRLDQHPAGAAFNPQTMRMEIVNYRCSFNWLRRLFVTVSPARDGLRVRIGISAWYLLRGRHVARQGRWRLPLRASALSRRARR
jgi:cytochrome bd-type quinol oxidase subunit 1